ncbi:MAG TPA: ribosome maturation factor RimP [Thioploca sp.]|nr:MAG: ribosome maturation factor RimP [Beggiatoa sp. 4572_84]RKZ62432.1 MAG: ribosome maturation factor RimP [Gammaproteobacteria bacterium]HDN26481.1 ribosome maturation factor RimP [Thioploca sp.]
MNLLDNDLQQLLAPVVTALGYELVGVERLMRGARTERLRVYIDSPSGISLSDCERVSYQASGVLDVQESIPGHYTLEVSSPGLDRPLFTLDHFRRFVGYKVKVRLTGPQDGRCHFTGMLQRVQDRNVIVVADGEEYSLPYEKINKAHLVPEEPHF